MTAGQRRKRGIRAAAAMAAVAALVSACSGQETPEPTIRVDRGTVSSAVSASGTLVAVTQQNLGFSDRGRLAELPVKVGDAVAAGQVLARLDDFALRQSLAQAEARLAQQRATLDKLSGSNAVAAAQANLDSANEILAATQASVDATAESDAAAVERARVQLDFDRSALEDARRQLGEDQAECDRSGGPLVSTTTTPTSTSQEPSPSPVVDLVRSTNPGCTAITADEQAVQQAERSVVSSETALSTAEQRERTDAASGQLQIANARQSVTTAQGNLEKAGTDGPADTSAQQAAVRDAQASVDIAAHNLEAAVLLAPVAGIVTEINGAVGDYLQPSAGAAARAPGSDARLPAAAAAAATGGSAGSASGAFIVLGNVDTFQLVAPFEQSDAAQIAANQRVSVEIDAVPGLTRAGTVVAVGPAATTISGVVSYYATIVLTETDPRLRDGQTAQADVLVRSVDNVLRVPSAAIRTEGGRSVVDVKGTDGARVVTPFSPGMVGDEYTEVVSGLNEGQEILLPTAQVSGTPEQQGQGPNGS